MRFNGVMAMVLVNDLDRALRFYRDTLGFNVQDEQEDWVMFEEGVGLQLSPEPLPEVNLNLNAVMLTLIVDSVDAAYIELSAKGVAFFLPPTESGGSKLATIRDTENNLVQLMQIC